MEEYQLWQKASILTGGLTHLWDKIKSYLTTWKVSNFGTGTYENNGKIKVSGKVTLTSYTTDESRVDFVVGSQKTSSTTATLDLTGVLHGVKMVQAPDFGATLKVISNDTGTKFVYTVWIDTKEFRWHTNAWFLQKGDECQLIDMDAPFFVCLLFW